MSVDGSTAEAELREARAAALNYLARREHSCQELETKLQRKGISREVATAVVETLRDENLVSDHRYAEAFVRSRVSRSQGPLKIRAELRRRGVADSIVYESMQPFEEQWQHLAFDWANRRSHGNPDRKEQARIYRSGTNRGFSHEHMMRAIDRLKSAP